LSVPLVAFLAIVKYLDVFSAIANSQWVGAIFPGNFPLAKRLLLLGFVAVFVMGAIASSAAVWKVVSNREPAEGRFSVMGRTTTVHLYRFAFPAAVVAALGMLTMLIATPALGWLAESSLPGNFGLLLTNTAVSFAVTVTIMALSTVLA
jgi:hypothetical protein